jgi:hypothetical protein
MASFDDIPGLMGDPDGSPFPVGQINPNSAFALGNSQVYLVLGAVVSCFAG